MIERVTFHSEETGFAALRVKVKGYRELVTVIGALASVNAGEWSTAQGNWVQDKEHGLQLEPRSSSRALLNRERGLKNTSPALDQRHRPSLTPIKPGPLQIGLHEDGAQRRCRAPTALQGLSGIVIPSRKIQARHIGQLCFIRGKNGSGQTGGEPYRRIGQTSGQMKSRLALRGAETWCFFLRLLIALALKGDSAYFGESELHCGRQ